MKWPSWSNLCIARRRREISKESKRPVSGIWKDIKAKVKDIRNLGVVARNLVQITNKGILPEIPEL